MRRSTGLIRRWIAAEERAARSRTNDVEPTGSSDTREKSSLGKRTSLFA